MALIYQIFNLMYPNLLFSFFWLLVFLFKSCNLSSSKFLYFFMVLEPSLSSSYSYSIARASAASTFPFLLVTPYSFHEVANICCIFNLLWWLNKRWPRKSKKIIGVLKPSLLIIMVVQKVFTFKSWGTNWMEIIIFNGHYQS